MVASTSDVSDVIEEAVRLLIAQFRPEKIILFGSWARGTANSDSDLDFLIVMPHGSDRRKTAIEMHRHLHDLSMPKDIIVTTDEEIVQRGRLIGTSLRNALREGKVVYERR